MTTTLLLAVALAAGVQATPATPAPQPQPQPAAAQVDARWSPWLGCWRPEPAGKGDARVCLVPGRDGAIRWLAVAGGQVADEQAVAADGQPHQVVDRDCRGTETARWLAGSARLVRTSDLTCGKDAKRTVTGLSFLAPGPVWVDAQAVDSEGGRRVRLQRYRRAADQHLPAGVERVPFDRAADSRAALTWTIDDVIEASRAVQPEVLQAAISEVNAPFPLSGKALVRLADAGVPASVIDLMVAVTNPKKFLVRRADGTSPGWGGTYGEWPGIEEFSSGGEGFGGYGGYAGLAGFAGLAVPWFYNPWMGLWGYDDFYWASCAYRGCGDPFGYYGGGWVDVGGGGGISGDTGGGGVGRPESHGRVVKGLGYTQVSVRPDPVRIGSVGSSGSGGDVVSSPSGSSGGSASPGGYSGGGGGGGDRTAVPK